MFADSVIGQTVFGTAGYAQPVENLSRWIRILTHCESGSTYNPDTSLNDPFFFNTRNAIYGYAVIGFAVFGQVYQVDLDPPDSTLTAFTFGLYPVPFQDDFNYSISITSKLEDVAQFQDNTFTIASITIGGSLTTTSAYPRYDISPGADAFRLSGVTAVGGSLTVTIAYLRNDISPDADTFRLSGVTAVGGSLTTVIAYARQDLKPVDTFRIASITIGGSLEVV